MIGIVPSELLEAMASYAPAPEAPRRSAGSLYTFDVDAWIAQHLPDAIGPSEWRGGRKWVLPVCPFNSDHTNRSAFVIEQQSGALVFGCQHNGCQGHRWRDLRELLEPRPFHDTVGKVRASTVHVDSSNRQGASPFENEPDRFTIKRITSRELDSGDYTTHYLVEDVVPEGQPMVIAAPLKSLKTTISVALAVALALGLKFLGKFWVPEAVNVLMLSGESGLSALQSAARRIAGSYGYSLGDVGRLFWSTDLPQLGSPEHLEALREALTRDEIAVVIVDPLYFCLPGGDAGNLMIVGGYLRKLAEVCDQCGATLIVIHHIRKTGIDNRHDPPELSHISWSGTAEWARSWILLNRRKEYVPGTGEHKLWMVTGGSAGHSGLHALNVFEGVGDHRTWQVEMLSADEVRQTDQDAKGKAKVEAEQAKIETAKRALVAVMVKFKEGETARTIKEAAGVSGTIAKLAFAALVQDGTIAPCEITKPNRKMPYEGFRIAEHTTHE